MMHENMNSIEKAITVYRNEVTAITWSFFVWKSINVIASKNEDVNSGINETALSWNTIISSLQTNFFITLGRLFDTDSGTFSLHFLLRLCAQNITQFSSESLRARKIKENNDQIPEWLDGFMKNTYQPNGADFRELRKTVKHIQRTYENIYKPIRHKVFAHKENAAIDTYYELFGKTNINQLEGIINVLNQLDKLIFDLFYNGKLNKIEDYIISEEERTLRDVELLMEKIKNTQK